MKQTISCAWGLCGSLLLSSWACSPPRMAVPPAVSKSSEVLNAEDRSSASGLLVDEGFKLGPYRVTDVDRDWNSTKSSSLGPFAGKQATTGYQYVLTQGKTKLTGTCGSTTKKQSLFGGGISWGSTRVACSCEGNDTPATLTWSEDESSMVVAGNTYRVDAIHETEEGSSQGEPVGFRAGRKDLVGAVEVSHPGRVWLSKQLSDEVKADASCLFVGLLLYQPPRDDD